MDPRRPSLQLARSRPAGIAATLLAHAALIAAWQQARGPALPDQGEPEFVQWVQVEPKSPQITVADDKPDGAGDAPAIPRANAAPGKAMRTDRELVVAPPAVVSSPATVLKDAQPSSAAPGPDISAGSARQMIEQARLDAGAADRALRKESKPTIVAPPDSPQIRMASKFREAAALAPNRWYEAPKIVELVNDGGDGARRFRVLTALGIYCVTERSPATSIDMIEKHGKQRITNCGHEHEQPANPQQWRTARD